MILELNPLDTLFFRDGKPFNKGAETEADTIFPPFPATIYGAFRTACFNQYISVFEKMKSEGLLNTPNDPTTKLRINNIHIKYGNDILFVTPGSILQNSQKFKVLRDFKRHRLCSKTNLSILVNNEDNSLRHQDTFIDELDMENYLQSSFNQMNKPRSCNLYCKEPKTGIALNSHTGTSQDECLYRIDMLRLHEDVRLVVDFDGMELNPAPMKLGGEVKYVYAQKIHSAFNIPFVKPEGEFLIYLNTPAVFLHGWMPGWLDPEDHTGYIPGTELKVKLLSAAVGKPQMIGGYDMARNQPKPMYKAVPAGSEYFFEILSGDAQELQNIHQKSISDMYPEQGFGISYIGKM